MNNTECDKFTECPYIIDVFNFMQEVFDEQQKQIARLQDEVIRLNDKLH